MEFLRGMRWFTEVTEWLQRPVPRPLLLLTGPTGTGKSEGVCEAVRLANLEMSSIGSDEDETPETLMKLLTAGLMQKSHSSQKGLVFVIDDGDAFFGRHTGHAVKADHLLDAAVGISSLVVVATLLYESPLLVDVSKKCSTPEGRVVHVKSQPIDRGNLMLLLNREFPNASFERVSSVCEARGGDVRGCRAELQSAFAAPFQASSSRLSRFDTLFSKAEALMGLRPRPLPPTQELANVVAGDELSLATMFFAHYPAASPRFDLNATATVADEFARHSTYPADFPEDFASHQLLQGATSVLRASRAASGLQVTRISFEGPLGGEAARRSEEAAATMSREAAVLLHRWDWATLARSRRLVECPRTAKRRPLESDESGEREEEGGGKKRLPRGLVSADQHDLFALMTIKHGTTKVPPNQMPSVRDKVHAFSKGLDLAGGPHPPWMTRPRPKEIDAFPSK